MARIDRELTRGEVVELEVRTHVKKIFGPILLAVLLVVLVVLAAVFLPDDLGGRQWILLAIVVVALVVAAVWVVAPILVWRRTVYVFTNRRLITRAGVLSKSGRDIPMFRINSVQYEKDFTDRFFGCGTLLISEASDEPPLELPDVPKVRDVQVTLNELLFSHYDDGDEGGNSREMRDRFEQRRADRRSAPEPHRTNPSSTPLPGQPGGQDAGTRPMPQQRPDEHR